MSQPGIGHAVNRGKKLLPKRNYQLLYQISRLFMAAPKGTPLLFGQNSLK